MSDAQLSSVPLVVATLHLLYCFQELYSAIMFIPVESVDGKSKVDEMDRQAWYDYVSKLQGMATSYVNKVD